MSAVGEDFDDVVDEVLQQLEDGRMLVPDHLWRGIVNHIIDGGDTGSFLTAMFENDFLKAATGADEVTAANFRNLALFLHNYAPSICFGSQAAVREWRTAGGIRGGAHRLVLR